MRTYTHPQVQGNKEILPGSSFSVSNLLSSSWLLWALSCEMCYNEDTKPHEVHWDSYFLIYFFMLHIKRSHFPDGIKVKAECMCVRLEQKSPVMSKEKPMQTYIRRLLSTWLSNRYFSMFNPTASTPLWYFLKIFFCSAEFSVRRVEQEHPLVHHVRFGSSVLGSFCCGIASVSFPVVQQIISCFSAHSWVGILC